MFHLFPNVGNQVLGDLSGLELIPQALGDLFPELLLSPGASDGIGNGQSPDSLETAVAFSEEVDHVSSV